MMHLGTTIDPISPTSHVVHGVYYQSMLLFRLFETLVSGDPIALISLPDVAISQELLLVTKEKKRVLCIYRTLM